MIRTTLVAPVTGWNLSSIPGCVANDPCEDLAFFTTFPYSCMKLEAASPEERYEVSLSPDSHDLRENNDTDPTTPIYPRLTLLMMALDSPALSPSLTTTARPVKSSARSSSLTSR